MLDNSASLLALVHDACDLVVAQPFDKAQDEYLLLRFGQLSYCLGQGMHFLGLDDLLQSGSFCDSLSALVTLLLQQGHGLEVPPAMVIYNQVVSDPV